MPPITTDTATLRKERGDEDRLGSLSHPTRSPVPSPSPPAGAPPPIRSFSCTGPEGWQHHPRRELSMYSGNKTGKRLI